MSENRPLRIITYLVPSLTVELFEAITQYIEATLKKETVLLYESRFSGPPTGRIDLFRSDVADLAFVSGASYQQLIKDGNKDWELLPVGGVFSHATRPECTGYYADVIIHKSAQERIKAFLDLRGTNWATNSQTSTSGHFVVLKTLRELGENPSFFGSVLDSGSHLNSIQMVASRQADVAAVDSNALGYALAKNPGLLKDIFVFDSIGPLPAYPIMVRSSMPADCKKAIVDALLQMHQVDPWNRRFAALRLARFTRIDKDIYLSDRETRESLAGLSASVRYY